MCGSSDVLRAREEKERGEEREREGDRKSDIDSLMEKGSGGLRGSLAVSLWLFPISVRD